MFLKCSKRLKNGKEHRSWSIVESRRLSDGRCVQRHVLYLGELTDGQEAAWQKSIEVFQDDNKAPLQLAIFPEDRQPPPGDDLVVNVKLNKMELHRPRQWGGCWLALELWRELKLDNFWHDALKPSRKGTPWDLVLTTLVVYRLLDPGSEWRLHREWFDRNAIGDLLDQDFRLAADHTLYRCLDKLLAHKEALFLFLKDRWMDLFGAKFEVLLYDLTSTYFECDVPAQEGLRRFGYSRDKRGDCVQIIIALIITPEGFPLGYEVLTGNTLDKTTLKGMLGKVEARYGKIQRTWLMDRGIPTEEVLEQMRKSDPPVRYLVGTPKGRLTKLEKTLAEADWQQAREGVDVKLVKEEGEIYVLAKSRAREGKERGMRKRRLKKLWKRLKELQEKELSYEQLLLKLGAAKAEAGQVWQLVRVELPKRPPVKTASEKGTKLKLSRKKERPKKGDINEASSVKTEASEYSAGGVVPSTKVVAEPLVERANTGASEAPKEEAKTVSFRFTLNRKRLRAVRKREGRYLLRSNDTGSDPAAIWQQYMQLTQVEEAFKTLKGDLALRPVFHQKDDRIEAHVFVSFLAYCLQVTLRHRLKPCAAGLTPRAVLEKLSSIQMVDVHLPTTDDRTLVLSRYTHPDNESQLLLEKLKLHLPDQAPPKITANSIPKAPKNI